MAESMTLAPRMAEGPRSTLTRARTRTGPAREATRARRRGFWRRRGSARRRRREGRPRRTRVPGAAARTWRWVKPRAATLEEGHAARAATRVRIPRADDAVHEGRSAAAGEVGARNARGARARVSDAACVAGDACIVDRLALGARGGGARPGMRRRTKIDPRRIGSRDIQEVTSCLERRGRTTNILLPVRR